MCWLWLGYDEDVWNPECKDGDDDLCERFEPMPDVDALRALAGELESGAQLAGGRKWSSAEAAAMERHLAEDYRTIARRIKKALGTYDKEED